MMSGAMMLNVSSSAMTMSPVTCSFTEDLDELCYEDLQVSDDCVDSILSSNNLDFDSLPNLFPDSSSECQSVDQDLEDFNRILETFTKRLNSPFSDVNNELGDEQVSAAVSPVAVGGCQTAAVVNTAEFGVVDISDDCQSHAVLEALDLESLLEQFEANEASYAAPAPPPPPPKSHVCGTSRPRVKRSLSSIGHKCVPSRTGGARCCSNAPLKMPRFSIRLNRDPDLAMTSVALPPAPAARPPTVNPAAAKNLIVAGASQPPASTRQSALPVDPTVPAPPTNVTTPVVPKRRGRTPAPRPQAIPVVTRLPTGPVIPNPRTSKAVPRLEASAVLPSLSAKPTVPKLVLIPAGLHSRTSAAVASPKTSKAVPKQMTSAVLPSLPANPSVTKVQPTPVVPNPRTTGVTRPAPSGNSSVSTFRVTPAVPTLRARTVTSSAVVPTLSANSAVSALSVVPPHRTSTAKPTLSVSAVVPTRSASPVVDPLPTDSLVPALQKQSPVVLTLPVSISLPLETAAPAVRAPPVVACPPPTRHDQTGPTDHDYCLPAGYVEPVRIALPLPALTLPSPPTSPVVLAQPCSPLKMKSVLKPMREREGLGPPAVAIPDPETLYSKLPEYYTSIGPVSVDLAPSPKTRRVSAVVPPSRSPHTVMTAIPQCSNVQTAKVVIPGRSSPSTFGGQRYKVVGSSTTSKENSDVNATGAPLHNRLPHYVTGLTGPKTEVDVKPLTCAATATAALPSCGKQGRTPKVAVKVEPPPTMPSRVAGAVAAAMQRVNAVPPPVLAPRMAAKPPVVVMVKTEPRLYEKSERRGRHSNRGDEDGRATRWRHRSRSSRSPSHSNSSRSHSRSSSRGRSGSAGSDSSWTSSNSATSRSSGSRSRTGRRRRHSRREDRSCSRSSRSTRENSSSRRHELDRHQEEEKQKQIEDRRVVHVGNIKPGTSEFDLERRFGKFGKIDDIKVHQRERGDAFAFITYRYKGDAFKALEHGNDHPLQPKYELSLGGRRLFCYNSYSDLDSLANNYEAKPPQILRKKSGSPDFDSLLQEMRNRNPSKGGKN